MALVPKIDPNKIFASNAPSQDKPAAFNNYEKGMDETRKNLGRPTIKQLNCLHQTADQKILWIHQNGGGLPYDPSIEYAENAVTLKDGELQKKQGAGWVIPYLGKSNNLDDVPSKTTARNNLDVYSKTEADIAIANATPTITNATETTAGKAKIATTAIAQAGTNDTDIITAKKLRAALNATGNAPISACRAWVCFNGRNSPPAILSSLNISSVVKNATGDYTLNFTTPFENSNYSVSCGGVTGGSGGKVYPCVKATSAEGVPLLKTPNQLRIACVVTTTTTDLYDMSEIYIGVFC